MKAKLNAAETKKPAAPAKPAPAKVNVMTLLKQTSVGRSGLLNFYGAEECPSGAIRLDVTDVYEWYVLELGPLKLAFNVGREM